MKITINETISSISLKDIHNNDITIPHSDKVIHLQFRRFAGCPVCNLHLHSFFTRADELDKANIQSVIVFHSSQQRMLEHVVDINDLNISEQYQKNFNLIADPSKKLYADFGLENTWKSLLHPKVICSAVKGLTVKSFAKPEKLETELVVPADFLINQKGEVIALKYGKHANDQWSVDDLLSLVK